MKFKDTVGKTFKFYGIHDTAFKLGRYIFEAVEDPDDGYRSYMQCINVVKDEQLVFLGKSFARVCVEEYEQECFDGYRLVDVDTGHVWLRFGTDHSDNYYPFFVFSYSTPEYSLAVQQADTIKKKYPQGWFYNDEIRRLNNATYHAIQQGEYDAAEDLMKELKAVINAVKAEKATKFL